MMFWLISGAIAIAVTLILAAAIRSARGESVSAADSDMAVYKDQLSEIDRDLARGTLSETEAEAVRVEVSRRLLDADKRSAAATNERGQFWPAALLIAAATLAGTFLLYTTIGAPGYPDLPIEARLAAIEKARENRPSQATAEEAASPNWPRPDAPTAEFLALMEQLRTAVAARPDDTQGLTLLAQNEARLGNFTAAREAQQALIAAQGNAAPLNDRLELLDLMVFATGGYVSPEAEALTRDILGVAPGLPVARYYLGLAEAQAGRADRAVNIWGPLLSESPPDAPWVPVLTAELPRLARDAGLTNFRMPEAAPGPSAGDIAAAQDMSPEDRQAMIETMVEGLAERLATDGGPATDWARLIRALGVLGQTDRASAIADEARAVFADRPADLAQIDAAAASIAQ